MWNIIFLVILIGLVVIYKGRVSESFNRLKSNTKVSFRPKYRDYNSMVNLSEQVQYGVVPEMGITIELIKTNYNDVMEMMLKDRHEVISVNQVIDVFRRNVDVTFPHYYLFELFFTQISQTSKEKHPLHEVMVAIKFGL